MYIFLFVIKVIFHKSFASQLHRYITHIPGVSFFIKISKVVIEKVVFN